jgi:hypothetical protein
LANVPLGHVPPLPPLAPLPWAQVAAAANAAFSGWLDPAAGVVCVGKGGVGGEPAVDPSRQLQRGDSEWFEEGAAVGGASAQV